MKNYLEIIYDKKRRTTSDYDEKFVDHLIQILQLKSGKFLDIGCGTKNTMRLFKKREFEVYGADILEFEGDKKSDQENFDIKYSNFENEKIKYDDNYFDIVFCKSVVEHIRNTKNIFNEAFRVLKPGGIAVILTPSWRHTYWGPFYIDPTHVTPFTESSLYDALKFANFERPFVEVFYQFPILWKYSFLKILCKFLSIFPIPYFPLHFKKKVYPDFLNTVIRFSNEPMLLAYAKK